MNGEDVQNAAAITVPMTPATLADMIPVSDLPSPYRMEVVVASASQLKWLLENEADLPWAAFGGFQNLLKDAEYILKLLQEPRWRAEDLERKLVRAKASYEKTWREERALYDVAAASKQAHQEAKKGVTAAKDELKSLQKKITTARNRLAGLQERLNTAEHKAEAATKFARKVSKVLARISA